MRTTIQSSSTSGSSSIPAPASSNGAATPPPAASVAALSSRSPILDRVALPPTENPMLRELAAPPPPPPPPPPPAPPVALNVGQAPAALTPAEILANPEHAAKTPAEKMALFVQPNFRPTIEGMSGDYAEMFAEMAAHPPPQLASVLHQACANERLLAGAGRIADAIAEGRATGSNVRGEMVAGQAAGYQVHPHTYAGESNDRDQIEHSLRNQFSRDAATVQEAFRQGMESGQLDTFYGSFTEPSSASCHAVRMNGVMGGLEEMQRDAGANPFDGSRPYSDPAVLQAAYALGDDEPTIRAALTDRGVPAAGIDMIVAQLRSASLI